jgi:tetraacyldisaccharide 4'-kinase
MKTPWWFLSKNLMAWILLPVSWLYYLVGQVVYFVRAKKPFVSNRPVICVGNILAGGVGKTPVVRAIANHLDSPVVMRGYKKSGKTGNIGDEATMLSRSGLVVHVGNRKANIALLNKQKEITPIVMDDGLQNPTINKDIKLVVFDEGLGFGNGFLLPAGPLRQPKKVLKNADAIIVIKNKKTKKNFKLPDGVPVFYATNHTVSPYDEDTKIVAFAGIGYPKKFFNSLKNVVAKRGFPDHYQYTFQDLDVLFSLANKKGAKLLTTEKDWVRLPIEIRDKIKYARLDTVIENRFYDWLKEKIEYANFKKTS